MLSRRTALFALAGTLPAPAFAQQVPTMTVNLRALSAGSTLYGLKWQVQTQGADYDVSIDQIGFVCGP